MSNIKGCDRCKQPFLAEAEGSSHFAGEINRRYETGEKWTEHVNWDFCPTCTGLMESPKAGQADYAKIRELEIQNGMAPTEPTPPISPESKLP